jgi:Uma2 family endonuclease
MSTTVAHGPYTVADLLRMREETDDRLELIDGEVFAVPSPTEGHQTSSMVLSGEFYNQIMVPGLGRAYHAPFDLYLPGEQVIQPDLFVVLPADAVDVRQDGAHGRPSLVVEIVSPSSRVQDRRRKRAIYARSGVPEYWIVDPAARNLMVLTDPVDGEYRTETVYGEGDIVRSATIPGIEIAATRMFPPTPGGGV